MRERERRWDWDGDGLGFLVLSMHKIPAFAYERCGMEMRVLWPAEIWHVERDRLIYLL